MNFIQLSSEVQQYILGWCDLKDIENISNTCKYMKYLIQKKK